MYLIMGLVVLFPLSTDPLRKIPPSRLALWPLDRRDHWILRLASPVDQSADVGPRGTRGVGRGAHGIGRTVGIDRGSCSPARS